MRFGAGGERGHLLVAHMYPLDLALAPDGVHQAVEAVPHNSVNSLNADCSQHICKLIGNGVGHGARIVQCDQCENEERQSPRLRLSGLGMLSQTFIRLSESHLDITPRESCSANST